MVAIIGGKKIQDKQKTANMIIATTSMMYFFIVTVLIYKVNQKSGPEHREGLELLR